MWKELNLKRLFLAVLGLSLLVVLLVVEFQDRSSKRMRAQVEERAEPLERQINALIDQRDRLQREYEEATAVPATEQLLFLDLDPRVYSEAFPRMRERGVSGMLGLDGESFPGDPGQMTEEQFREILAEGWECCLICRGTEDFEAWDRDISARLREAGLEKPRAVYFEENSFDPAWSEQISRCGFTSAIHHGEGRLSLIAEEAGEELWLCGSHPWNYAGVKQEIEMLVRYRGQHCFTVRFAGPEGEVHVDDFAAESFRKMLDFVQPFLDEGSLRILGISQARELHDPARNGSTEAKAQLDAKDAELDEQIRVLREQLYRIYSEWDGE